MHFCGCMSVCVKSVSVCTFVCVSVVINVVDSVGFRPPALSCNETEPCRVSCLKGRSQVTSCPVSHSSLFTVLTVRCEECVLCLSQVPSFFLYFCIFPALFRLPSLYSCLFSDSFCISPSYQFFQEPKFECNLLWFSAETQYVSALSVRPCFCLLPAWYANTHTHTPRTQLHAKQ